MAALLSIWKGEVRPAARAPVSLATLLAAVADDHRLAACQLRSRQLEREVVAARLDFYRRAEAAGHSQSAIGRFVGRDPSTIHSAVVGKAAVRRARQKAQP